MMKNHMIKVDNVTNVIKRARERGREHETFVHKAIANQIFRIWQTE